MKTQVTFSDAIESFAGCEFLQVAENFMRGNATIRDICEARKFFVMQMRFEFGLSEAEADRWVRHVEGKIGLLRR